jgi:hypothetical protein
MEEENLKCSRCLVWVPVSKIFTELSEITACIDCKNMCRGCSANVDEEMLEFGYCYSCSLDIDEQAEEDGYYDE